MLGFDRAAVLGGAELELSEESRIEVATDQPSHELLDRNAVVAIRVKSEPKLTDDPQKME
jgi:hypothetical protein